MKIAVIGAGSWGTAVARLLGLKGYDVTLWAHSIHTANGINATHKNPDYLTDVDLPNVVGTVNYREATQGMDAIVFAVPSRVFRQCAQNLAPFIGGDIPLVSLSKGIEVESGATMCRVLEEECGHAERIAVLSGPNHAEEVAREKISCTVIASASSDIATFFQSVFATDYFRVYISTDVNGVCVCGATKNIYAIAAGIATGFGLGDNAIAALMARSCAELSRLIAAIGGNEATCLGLAGMGDLVATCMSPHSRNRCLGLVIADGGDVSSYENKTHMIAEGAIACKSVLSLAEGLGVDMPIARCVEAVVWRGLPIANAIVELMGRPVDD